jgi:hypothetical protein
MFILSHGVKNLVLYTECVIQYPVIQHGSLGYSAVLRGQTQSRIQVMDGWMD